MRFFANFCRYITAGTLAAAATNVASSLVDGSDLERENADLRERLQALERENASLRKRNQSLEQKNAVLQEEQREVIQEEDSLQEKIWMLSSSMNDIISIAKALFRRVQEGKICSLEDIQNQIAEVARTALDLEEEPKYREKEIADFKLESVLDDRVRVYNALRCGGIDTVEELLQYKMSDLLELRCFGEGSARDLYKALACKGLYLTPETNPRKQKMIDRILFDAKLRMLCVEELGLSNPVSYLHLRSHGYKTLYDIYYQKFENGLLYMGLIYEIKRKMAEKGFPMS